MVLVSDQPTLCLEVAEAEITSGDVIEVSRTGDTSAALVLNGDAAGRFDEWGERGAQVALVIDGRVVGAPQLQTSFEGAVNVGGLLPDEVVAFEAAGLTGRLARRRRHRGRRRRRCPISR